MIIQPPSGLCFCSIWIEKCPNKNPCFVSGLYAWKELNKLHLEWSKWSIFLTMLLVDNGWYLKTQVLPLSILLPHASVPIQLYQSNSKTDLPKRQLSLLSSSCKQQLPVSHTDNTSLDILSIFIILISQNRMPSLYRCLARLHSQTLFLLYKTKITLPTCSPWTLLPLQPRSLSHRGVLQSSQRGNEELHVGHRD